MLSLSGICKSYTLGPVTTEILKGVDLEISAGDMLSIMGPSGCGKSTMMNIIGLLDRPTDGHYRLDGIDVSSLDDRELSSLRNARIGFVFQSFHLLPRLSARDNVGLPLVYRGVQTREIRERSLTALERVDMADRAGHKPRELSGGQQQRVALARALVGDPGIILADEPTGALDPKTGREIIKLFRLLNEEEGATVVIITHDSHVAQQCRRRAHVEEGILVEEREAA